MVAETDFDRHPQCDKLNLGLTVFFPLFKARNRYGVIIVRVKRGEIADIAAQLKKKIPKPLVMWGNTATQAYAMERGSRLYVMAFDEVLSKTNRCFDK